MNISLPNVTLNVPFNIHDSYCDSRFVGHQGPNRNVRLPRTTPSGGGAIAKSGDSLRCAVTGKECEYLKSHYLAFNLRRCSAQNHAHV